MVTTRDPTTDAITSLYASADLYDTDVTTLAWRREYPDDIKDEYWQDLTNVAINDYGDKMLEDLKNSVTDFKKNLNELFDLEKIGEELQGLNDKDGARLEDAVLEAHHGNLVLGLDLHMKDLD